MEGVVAACARMVGSPESVSRKWVLLGIDVNVQGSSCMAGVKDGLLHRGFLLQIQEAELAGGTEIRPLDEVEDEYQDREADGDVPRGGGNQECLAYAGEEACNVQSLVCRNQYG